MNLSLLWPKLIPALAAAALWVAVYRERPLPALRRVAGIIALMLARDVLYVAVPLVPVYLVADVGVFVLYVLWLRAYTGPRRIDIPWFVLSAGAAAAGLASGLIAGYPQLEFGVGVWLLLAAVYLAVGTGVLTADESERVPAVVQSRTVLSGLLLLIQLADLLYGYNHLFVQSIVIPVSYLAPLWLCLVTNHVLHAESRQSAEFYSSSLEATYGFMEHLGNAITAKIDPAQVLSTIIAAASRNVGADAGAILIVDEYEDVLRVKATQGIFPPLGPVPPFARVKPASLKRYFEETPIPLGETVLGDTVKTGEAVFVRDCRQDARLRHNTADDIQFCSSLACVPLAVGDRVLGVLAVVKRAANQFFHERDFRSLQTLADYASLTIDNLYTYSDVVERRQIEREVDIAAQIQSKLVPARLPDAGSAALAVYNKPARGVSGDYYDAFRLDDDRIGLVVCDVAGKGVPAALVMVMIRSVLHLLVSPERDAAETLTSVNQGITGRIELDHFATVAFLIYNHRTREAHYANAAHLPLLLHRHESGKTFRVEVEGLPLGVEKNTRYQQKSFRLEKGDLLLLCTDGIVEAMDPAGKPYGVAGLRRAVEQNAALPANELVAAVREDLSRFGGTTRQHDDQTLLVLQAR